MQKNLQIMKRTFMRREKYVSIPGTAGDEIIENAVGMMDGNFDHPYAWNNFPDELLQEAKDLWRSINGPMDQRFAKDFYQALKHKKKKAAKKKRLIIATIIGSNMSNNDNTIIPDDIISTINDFKRSKWFNDTDLKRICKVYHRIAVVRRNLGAKLQILTEHFSR